MIRFHLLQYWLLSIHSSNANMLHGKIFSLSVMVSLHLQIQALYAAMNWSAAS